MTQSQNKGKYHMEQDFELEPELTVDAFKSLDPTVKNFYKEVKSVVKADDGNESEIVTYVPKIKGVNDASNLVSALDHRKTEIQLLNEKLKKKEEEVKRLSEEKNKTEKEKAMAQQQKMADEGRWKELHELQLKEREEEKLRYEAMIQERDEKYRTAVLDREIKDYAIKEGGVMPERLEHFMLIHRNRFEIGPDGKTPLCRDANGNLNGYSLTKQFEILRNETPWAIRPNRAGGGSPSNSPTVNHNGSTPFISLSENKPFNGTVDLLAQMAKGNMRVEGLKDLQ